MRKVTAKTRTARDEPTNQRREERWNTHTRTHTHSARGGENNSRRAAQQVKKELLWWWLGGWRRSGDFPPNFLSTTITSSSSLQRPVKVRPSYLSIEN